MFVLDQVQTLYSSYMALKPLVNERILRIKQKKPCLKNQKRNHIKTKK